MSLILLPAILVLSPLTEKLDSVLNDPKMGGATVAAYVSDLDGNVLYEKNSRTRVMPASNQKLFSSAFALWSRGSDYRPQTKIWKEWNRIIVESPGDPLLTYDTLKEAADKLELDRSLPVYVNEAYAPGYGGGWEFEDLPNKYAAPVSAFTIERGAFAIWNVDGKPKLLPEAFGVKIVRGDTLNYDPFARRVIVPTDLPNETKRLDTLSLPRGDEAASMLLGRWFNRTKESPSNDPALIIVGRPISMMLKACLPPSDNNIAEHLLLIGASKDKPLPEDPYPDARKKLSYFLESVVQLPAGDVIPYDGSGLSKENLVTTRAIGELLLWANRQPTADVWRDALAKTGQPGTLSKRLGTIEFSGKTGTLNRVVALSGYLKNKDGKTVVASIVLNNFRCSSSEAQGVEDSFIKALTE